MMAPLIAWVWQPIASPLHLAGGGAVLAALAVFAYVRVFRSRPVSSSILLVMRLAVIAAVSVLLLGPSREKPRPEQSQQLKLTILLDTSESMRTEDCGAASRMEHVARNVVNPEQMQRLKENFQVDLRGFDERLHPVAMDQLYARPADLATGKATHVAESVASALTQLNATRDGDVLLVVSDGRDTEDASIQPAAAAARAKHIPVYTVAVGGSQSSIDAAVLAVPMQDSLLPGESGAILVKIYQSGLDGRSTTLRLKRGDEVTQFPIDFGNKRVVELQVPVQEEEPGQYEFQLTIDAVTDETELTNNAQTVFCEVMKRRIRVLVLEGQPFWDTKFLAQSLRKDERVELTQITQVGELKRETIVSRVEEGAPSVPVTAEHWANYDVVILGRGMEHVLDPKNAELLVRYVVDGGGQVIFARGRAYDRTTDEGRRLGESLAVLEPVVWGNSELQQLSIELTQSGRSSAWLAPLKMGTDVEQALARLPGFEVMQSIEREKPGTLVMARAFAAGGPANSSLPALTRMNYGRGTIVAVLGEGLWRWSLLPPEAQDLRGFYDTFWSNLVRWLALGGDFPPGQQIALQLSRTTARLGDGLSVDVAYKITPADGAAPQLELIAPDGSAVDVGLHQVPGAFPRFRATLEPAVTGIHKVKLHAPGMTPAELEQNFNVYDVNLERLQTAVNPMPLQILAEHSGGAFLEDSAIGDLHQLLERHLASMEMPPQLEYVWDKGLILTLLLLWMGLEWIVRRITGLW